MLVQVHTTPINAASSDEEYWNMCTQTPVVVHVQFTRMTPNWFFLTEGSELIANLKDGWNSFGRHNMNTFEFRCESMELYEFSIFISDHEATFPVLHVGTDNIRLNGHPISREDSPYTLGHRANIGIVSGDALVYVLLRHFSTALESESLS